MSNIISHPRFNRPKIHQPHPRRRKGTINFRHRAAWARMRRAEALKESKAGRTPEQARERSERLRQRWADLHEAEIATLHIPNEGMEAHAVLCALMNAGLSLTYDGKRNALVLYAREPLEPRPAS